VAGRAPFIIIIIIFTLPAQAACEFSTVEVENFRDV
jgi:hypothetical protein